MAVLRRSPLLLLCTLIFFSLLAGTGALVITGVGSSGSVTSLWRQLSSGYQYRRDNVVVQYTQEATAETALATFAAGNADYVSLDSAIPQDLVPSGMTQVPLAGVALVIAYNLPGLSYQLVLDGNTLAQIFMGSITSWADPAILALNQNLTSADLPDVPITMSFTETLIGTAGSQVFKTALSIFNAEFAQQLNAAGGLLAGLPPAQNGKAIRFDNPTDRFAYVGNNAYSITYIDYPAFLQQSNMSYAAMVNKAGNIVQPTAANVQSAMNDFIETVHQGDLSADIIDGNGTNTWPMSYVSLVGVLNNTNTTQDCTPLKQFLEILAWVATNGQTETTLQTNGWAPLTIAYKKRLIDLLVLIQCQDQQALTVAYLIGTGGPLSAFYDWAQEYSTSSYVQKYFDSTTTAAITAMQDDDVDFGATSYVLSQETLHEIGEDVELFTITAFPMVFVYNLPEILNKGILVLNMNVVAGILRNTITHWRDEAILALNPTIEDLLPNREILPVFSSGFSVVTQVWTQVLAEAVRNWNSTVGVTGYPDPFPVVGSNNSTLMTGTSTVTIPYVAANPYSFVFASAGQIITQRNLREAAIVNAAGKAVQPTTAATEAALQDADITNLRAIWGPAPSGYPVVTFNSLIAHTVTTGDCVKTRALYDFMWWSQSSTTADLAADRNFVVVASKSSAIKRRMVSQLSRVRCNGQPASSIYSCIMNDMVCSDHGVCVNSRCQCDDGFSGSYCQSNSSSSDDTGTILALSLGIAIPVVGILLLIMACVIACLCCFARKKGGGRNDWEISTDELEMGDPLGAGGYGEVYRARWRGTEVAVKMIPPAAFGKDTARSFIEEVRVMTALRHPNVVLFMAACTKPPKMCIVMEYMALGSLYELLHNELIPELPFTLKAKMAYQAAKGMHFLHSSGIVHRDLKSLNLLLDNKWNVKVSDFGLTRFREEMKKSGAKDAQGSLHWTAPEILNESPEIDYILADVYSFGVILWELMTRRQPYAGLSPAAVAVAVIRDNLRPTVLEEEGDTQPDYVDLMVSCWHQDPTIRPTFLEIMTRLSSMHGDSSTAMFTSRSSSSSATGTSNKPKIPRSNSSWTLPSDRGSVSSKSSGGSRASSKASRTGRRLEDRDAVRPPEGEVTIVFTDITRAASLWEYDPNAMRDATLLHNEALRSILRKHRGYEVIFIRDRNSGEGSFCMAFQDPMDAINWCMDAQRLLLTIDWPRSLLEHPGAVEEWGDTDDKVLFKGLRVRMGVHLGTPKAIKDVKTRRVEYSGPTVTMATRITALTHGGQILLSHEVYERLRDTPLAQEKNRILYLGKFSMPELIQGEKLYELRATGLEARFFGGVTQDKEIRGKASLSRSSRSSRSSVESYSSGGSVRSHASSDSEVQSVVGDGLMFKEDSSLTSANLCRWIINYDEIQLGKQIGMGSYGIVYRGRWKGVEVAVKRFIKQKLDERRMLEFRAEMAFLSELHHPNIVLFIGACVRQPNMCIVTEYVRQGSLKDIISNTSIKLSWGQKLSLMRSAALGVDYLHSLQPVIVHRDLKPSNLLVDDNGNVKVADFGFARIKEDNATMTRCGTPCWTAPEIIQGQKYSEKADLFSFGIIMWEVLTRRQPYAGRNFMDVSLDVLEGRRPQVPPDTPQDFAKLIKKCWHSDPNKRPAMEDVIELLEDHLAQCQGSGGEIV